MKLFFLICALLFSNVALADENSENYPYCKEILANGADVAVGTICKTGKILERYSDFPILATKFERVEAGWKDLTTNITWHLNKGKGQNWKEAKKFCADQGLELPTYTCEGHGGYDDRTSDWGKVNYHGIYEIFEITQRRIGNAHTWGPSHWSITKKETGEYKNQIHVYDRNFMNVMCYYQKQSKRSSVGDKNLPIITQCISRN